MGWDGTGWDGRVGSLMSEEYVFLGTRRYECVSG